VALRQNLQYNLDTVKKASVVVHAASPLRTTAEKVVGVKKPYSQSDENGGEEG